MKSILITLISMAAFATAEEPKPAAEQPAKQVVVDMQIVTMPAQAATPLIADLRDPKKSDAAVAQIQQMLAKKEATLIAWPMLAMQPGQQSVAEDINEVRYASEFEPPSVKIDPDYSSTAKTEKKRPPVTLSLTEFTPTPTAFETKNTGVTLQVEPTYNAADNSWTLQYAAQRVALTGYDKTTIEIKPAGTKVTVELPKFRSNKVTSTSTIASGKSILVGVFRAIATEGEMELFILRATAAPAN